MTDFSFCKLLASGPETFKAEFAASGNNLLGWTLCSSEIAAASAMVAFATVVNKHGSEISEWSPEDLKSILREAFPTGVPCFLESKLNDALEEGCGVMRVVFCNSACRVPVDKLFSANPRLATVDKRGVFITHPSYAGKEALYVCDYVG